MSETRVKICGSTRPEDAALAAELGASMIGMIFYDGSPRHVCFEKANSIIDAIPDDVIPVGVFVGADADSISAITNSVPLGAVQLHKPNEDTLSLIHLPVIMAYSVDSDFDFGDTANGGHDFVLLDTKSGDLHGGTGRSFDWSLIPGDLDRSNLLLAGGLNPGNVADAIRTVRPAFVDLSSGVEDSPGVKNESLLRQLFNQIEVANNGI